MPAGPYEREVILVWTGEKTEQTNKKTQPTNLCWWHRMEQVLSVSTYLQWIYFLFLETYLKVGLSMQGLSSYWHPHSFSKLTPTQATMNLMFPFSFVRTQGSGNS
jgi:hypothetical protein